MPEEQPDELATSNNSAAEGQVECHAYKRPREELESNSGAKRRREDVSSDSPSSVSLSLNHHL